MNKTTVSSEWHKPHSHAASGGECTEFYNSIERVFFLTHLQAILVSGRFFLMISVWKNIYHMYLSTVSVISKHVILSDVVYE